MSPYDLFRLFHYRKYATLIFMRRHRVVRWWGAPVSEAEMRAMWGDR